MSKFITKFETTAAYEAAKDSLFTPNVSLIKETNVVNFAPYVPSPTPSHDYVKIGGIKWATMNVGANSITDTGLYFQWGDAQGYTASEVGSSKYFNWVNYKYATSSTNMNKYNRKDGYTTLLAEDDAVQAAWGGSWRMPTTEEFRTLRNATTTAWTSSYEGSGVAGLVFTSNADSSKKLFFPAAGFCNNSSVSSVGSIGHYWSSSLYTSDVARAYFLYFDKSYMLWQDDNNRCGGRAVRGVLAE